MQIFFLIESFVVYLLNRLTSTFVKTFFSSNMVNACLSVSAALEDSVYSSLFILQ